MGHHPAEKYKATRLFANMLLGALPINMLPFESIMDDIKVKVIDEDLFKHSKSLLMTRFNSAAGSSQNFIVLDTLHKIRRVIKHWSLLST